MASRLDGGASGDLQVHSSGLPYSLLAYLFHFTYTPTARPDRCSPQSCDGAKRQLPAVCCDLAGAFPPDVKRVASSDTDRGGIDASTWTYDGSAQRLRSLVEELMVRPVPPA